MNEINLFLYVSTLFIYTFARVSVWCNMTGEPGMLLLDLVPGHFTGRPLGGREAGA